MAAFPGGERSVHFITRARVPDRRRRSTDRRRIALSEKHLTGRAAPEIRAPAQIFTAGLRVQRSNGMTRAAAEEVAMNVLYNSENYYVVEFPGCAGIELVDKTTGRAGFLEGEVELKFRASMADLAAREPSVESVDEFLGNYDALLTNRVTVH
jgi:hypothetical protein